MTAASWPDHLLTPAEWDALPQDTSRCHELVEGVLLAVPKPAPLHQRAMWRLCSQIEDQLPAELTVLHYWLVDLDKSVTLTAYTLIDGNYEHVAGDVAGTVTIPSDHSQPSRHHLNPDALITR